MYYFDHSATTQPLKSVIETYSKVAQDYFANPSSAHGMGEESKQLLHQARKQIADILDYSVDEIYFTGSGTEANNWFLRAVIPALYDRQGGKNYRLLISPIEHPSISKQIPVLEKLGYQVELLQVDQDGMIDIKHLERLLEEGQVLALSTMAVNNEVGAVQDIQAIGDLLKLYPQVIWHVDGVQAVTTQLDLLKEARIDCLSLSSHKFHAVRGVGIFAKRQRVPSLPIQYGGGQERDLRSGTENLAGIVATSKALRLAQEAQETSIQKIRIFRQALVDRLEANHWQVFAKEADSHIVCASLAPMPGEVLLHAFEALDIYVSTTSACSSRNHQEHTTLRAMGISSQLSNSAIRWSLSQHTKAEEVDYLLSKIPEISQQFIK